MKYYDKYIRQGACHWREYKRTPTDERGYKTIVDDSLAAFKGEKGSILDVGCGDGLPASKLAQLGLRVTGLDIDQTGIDLAKEICGKGIDFICSSVEDFQMKEFDYLYSLNTIEHLKDPIVMVKIMKKIRNYGVIVTDDAENCKTGNEYHEREFTKSEFKELFKDFKLEEITMRDNRFFGYKISKA